MYLRKFLHAVILTIFLICTFSAYSQINIKWNSLAGGTATYEGNFEEGRSVKQTPDGGIIMAGSTNSINGDITTTTKGGLDFVVIKVNASGTIEWLKSFGGSGTDVCNSVINTSDGGFLLSGYSNSNNGDVTTNKGRNDVWLIKISSTGTLQWQKTFGGLLEDEAKGAIQSTDGGYVITGYTFSTNGDVSGNKGQSDVWVFKVDSNGNLLWQKTYGGSNLDEGNSIHITQDGSYIIGGSTFSNGGDVTNKKQGQDAWVFKINSNGVLQWQKALGGNSNEFANSVVTASDGSLYFTGGTSSNDGDVSGNHGGLDMWVVKLTSAGDIAWQKCFGGTLSDGGNTVALLNDGSLAVVGYAGSSNGDVSGNAGLTDMWAVRISNTGDLVWQNCLGGSGSEIGYAVAVTVDNSLLCFGRTNSTNGDVAGLKGGTDQWLVKLSASNSIIFQKTFGGNSLTAKNIFNQVLFTPIDNGSIAAGYSNSYALTDFKGKEDYFISKYDSLGNIKWQKTLGGSEEDIATSVCISKDSGYLIAGYSISDDGDVSSSIGSYDAWVVKLDSLGVLLWEMTYGGTDDDFINSITPVSDGGFILAGHSFSNDGDASGNKGNADYWVLKISQTGTVIWKRMFGGPDDDIAKVVIKTHDDGFFITGNSASETGDISNNKGVQDVWAIKLNKDGNLVWQQSYGGSNNDGANAAMLTADNSLVIAGFTNSNDTDISFSNGGQDIWVLRINSSGVLQWQKTYGGSGYETATGIILNPEAEFTVTGYTASSDKDVTNFKGIEDLWLLGIQNNGNLRWQKTFGGTLAENGNSINLTAKGNYLVGGYTKSENGDLLNINPTLKAETKAWLMELNNCPLAVINANGPIEFCSGNNVLLSTASAQGYSYQWYFNGTAINNEKKETYSATQQGSYTIAVTNTAGCTSQSAPVVVTVKQTPAVPIIVPQGSITLCQGDEVELKITTTPGVLYDWLVDDNSILGLTTQASIFAFNAGNYSVVAQNQANGCRSANAVPAIITVNSLPLKPTITIDGSALVSNKSAGNQWFLNDVAISGATSQRYTPGTPGFYTVTVKENNCESTPSDPFNYVITSVTNYLTGLNLLVYPNPVRSGQHVFISWNTNLVNMNKIRISVTDMTGRRISDAMLSSSPYQLKLANSPGIYIIWINSSDGKLLSTSKILVQ